MRIAIVMVFFSALSSCERNEGIGYGEKVSDVMVIFGCDSDAYRQ